MLRGYSLRSLSATGEEAVEAVVCSACRAVAKSVELGKLDSPEHMDEVIEKDRLLNADFPKTLGGAIDNAKIRNETRVRRAAAMGSRWVWAKYAPLNRHITLTQNRGNGESGAA
jgi:uncharacterized Zn finger protein